MRQFRTIAGLLPVLAFGAVAAPCAARAEGDNKIVVELDRATLVGLPPRSSNIVLGNPLVVRVTPLTTAPAVLTGTAYGETNMIVLDDHGQVLLETTVLVVPQSDAGPLLQRGAESTAYSCQTRCQVTNDLRGHGTESIAITAEAPTRNNAILATPQAAAAPSGGRL